MCEGVEEGARRWGVKDRCAKNGGRRDKKFDFNCECEKTVIQ